MSAEPLALLEPYVGPRPFKLDEKYFYGREAEIRELRDLLIARHVVLLYSPSGAGKTSLIQAGLIPQLVGRAYRVLHVIRVGAALPPGINAEEPAPNRYLFSTLSSLEESFAQDARLPQEQLAHLDLRGYLALRRPEVALEEEPLGEVLIFDQFEEALTLDVTDLAAKHAFFAALGEALDDPGLLALFSMREDYIASLDPFLVHLPDRLNIRLRIDRLTERQAIQAIQRPAREWTPPVDFCDEAAQELAHDLQQMRVQDLSGQVASRAGLYIEPVQLQVVCQRIWRNRLKPGEVSTEDLRNLREADQEIAHQYAPASGGQVLSNVDLALSAYYAEKVADVALVSGVPERAIRAWFERRMITAQGLRGMVMQGDAENQGLATSVIIALVNTYLVRSEERRGATWFELAHDRLIEPVRLNNAWWFQNRLTTLQRLASLWEQADRSARLLALDVDLQDCEHDAQAGDLTQTEQEFLTASQQEAQRLEEERRQRQLQLETAQRLAEEQRQRVEEQAKSLRLIRRFAIALVVFLIAAVLLAFFAMQQARVAQNQRATATVALADSIIQRQKAAAALEDSNIQRLTATFALGDSNIQRQTATVALGKSQVEGTRAANSEQKAVISLQTATAAQGAAEEQRARAETALLDDKKSRSRTSAALAKGSRQDDPVGASLFSLQAFVEADTAEARAALLDSLLVNQQSRFEPESELVNPARSSVYALAISPDGRYLAYGTNSGWVEVKDYQTGSSLFSAKTGSQVFGLAFDRAGKTLAGVNAARELSFWDVPSGDKLSSLTLRGKSDYKNGDVVFDPQGDRLAVGLGTGEVAIVDLADRLNPSESYLSPSHGYGVNAVAWSPDGSKLASASLGGSVKIWDTQTWDNKDDILLDPCPNFKPSGDGRFPELRTAAWSPDGALLAFGGHCGAFGVSEITPDGREGATRRFALPSAVFRQVNSLDFSPDGQYLVAGLEYPEVAIYDVQSGKLVPDDLKFKGNLKEVRFNPQPDRLEFATADKNGDLRIFEIKPEQKLVQTLAEGLPRVGIIPGSTAPNRQPAEVLALAAKPGGNGVTAVINDPVRGVVISDITPDGVVSNRYFLGRRASSAAFTADLAELILAWGDIKCIVRTEDCNNAISPASLEVFFAMQNRQIFNVTRLNLSDGMDGGTVRFPGANLPDKNLFGLSVAPNGDVLGIVDGSLISIDPDHQSDYFPVLWLLDNSRLYKEFSKPFTAAELSTAEWAQRPSKTPVTAAASAPNGNTLAAGNRAGEIKIWRQDEAGWVADNNLVSPHSGEVTALVISPDNHTLAIAYADRLLQLWDLEKNQPIGGLLSGAPAAIRSLAFDETGKTLYSGDGEGNLLAWNLNPVNWAEQVCEYSKADPRWGEFFDTTADRCDTWVEREIKLSAPSSSIP